MSQQGYIKRMFFSALADCDIDEVKRMIAVNSLHHDIDGDEAVAWTTPLILATQEGHLQIVRFLLDEGADVNKVNKV